MPYSLIYGERTLRSVANATYQDGVEFLALAAEIPIKATVNLYPLEAANQALLDLKHSRINGEAVLEVGAATARRAEFWAYQTAFSSPNPSLDRRAVRPGMI